MFQRRSKGVSKEFSACRIRSIASLQLSHQTRRCMTRAETRRLSWGCEARHAILSYACMQNCLNACIHDPPCTCSTNPSPTAVAAHREKLCSAGMDVMAPRAKARVSQVAARVMDGPGCMQRAGERPWEDVFHRIIKRGEGQARAM